MRRHRDDLFPGDRHVERADALRCDHHIAAQQQIDHGLILPRFGSACFRAWGREARGDATVVRNARCGGRDGSDAGCHCEERGDEDARCGGAVPQQ